MDEKIERLMRESVGQLLMKAGRLVDERALEAIRSDPEAPPVRPAHTRLFPHLSMEGVRITELADRLGVSKQAAQPLVADLVAWGVVELVPDPTDGRAKLARWSPRGLQALQHGLGVLATVEARLRARVGDARWNELHETLLVLVEELDGPLGVCRT